MDISAILIYREYHVKASTNLSRRHRKMINEVALCKFDNSRGMPSPLRWAGFTRMLLINDLFFNSSVVAHRVTKLGAPRAQHLGLNCIYKICEGVHHGEGNPLPQNYNTTLEII